MPKTNPAPSKVPSLLPDDAPHASVNHAQSITGLSFEAAMKELELLTKRAEQRETGLDEAVQLYERGIALIQHCQGQLAAVEDRIKELDGELLKTTSVSKLTGGSTNA